MSKDKKSKKSTKPVKTEREAIATSDYSPTLQTILSDVKKYAKGYAEQTVPGMLRVYVGKGEGRVPIARITGITTPVPNVEIKPRLRERVKDGTHPDAKKFMQATGLKNTKNWKAVFNGSNYAFVREQGADKLTLAMRIFAKHIKANGIASATAKE